jgi:hypothetical protein
VLVEVIAYLLLVSMVFSALTASVWSFRRLLAQRAQRDEQEARWTEASEWLRDDLRAARRVAWRPRTAPEAGERIEPAAGAAGASLRLLSIERLGGAEVVWECSPKTLTRSEQRAGGRPERREFGVAVCGARMETAYAPGGKGFWNLQQAAPGGEVRVTGKPVFILLMLSWRAPDGPVRAEHVGASTRAETAVGDAP